MPNRYRMPYRAIGRSLALIALCAVVASAQTPKLRPQHETQSHAPAASHHDDADAHKELSPTRVILLNANEIEKKAAWYQRQQQEQPPPDWWTRGGVIAAIIIGLLQTCVFGYQALKLRQTVKDGEKAISAATKAAEAATRQADIAETALKGLERPYVFVQIDATKVLISVQVAGDSLRAGGKSKNPIIDYTIENFGRTPAIITSISAELALWREPAPDYRYFPNVFMENDFVLAVRDPRKKELTATLKQNLDGFERLLRGEVFYWFIGRVDYEDAAGEPYFTEFCWCYHGKTEGKDKPFISQAGCEKWNRRK